MRTTAGEIGGKREYENYNKKFGWNNIRERRALELIGELCDKHIEGKREAVE